MNVIPTSLENAPVSVAMATYNGAKYLEEQLDSILSQTLPPKEICVSDDQSSDDTVVILEKYSAKGWLRYSVNEERLGYVGNFKKAVSGTTPDHYIALSDQDDIWLPEKISTAMEKLLELDSQHPAMVYSDLIFVDENRNLINTSFRNELGQDTYQHCLETLLFGGFVNGCTILMNPVMKNYFDSMPEYEFITHDTWVSLIAYTFGSVYELPESFIHYRKHTNNTTDLTGLKKSDRFSRIGSEIVSAMTGSPLFEKELNCVGEFYRTFSDRLDSNHRRIITQFLNLSGKSYIRKKIALRLFFAGKWV